MEGDCSACMPSPCLQQAAPPSPPPHTTPSPRIAVASGEKVVVTRRRTDGGFVVARGNVTVDVEGVTCAVGPGRVVGLQNLFSSGLSDPVIGEEDAGRELVVTATDGDTLLLRITRADLIRCLGGLEAPLPSVGNLEGCCALVGALASDVAARKAAFGIHDDSVLHDVATASVVARCKRFLTVLDAQVQLDPSVASSVLHCVVACDFFTQRAATLSPTGAPIINPPASLVEYARDVFNRYLSPTALRPAVRDMVPEDVRALVEAMLPMTGAGASSTTGAGSGRVGGDDSGRSSTPVAFTAMASNPTGGVPVTLFADVIGALDYRLADIVARFRDSEALRQLLQFLRSSLLAVAAAATAALSGSPGASFSAAPSSPAGSLGLLPSASTRGGGAFASFIDVDPRATLAHGLVKRSTSARFAVSRFNRCVCRLV